MKKYLVSLASVVSCNFEVKIKANSEKQALKKALNKWYDKDNLNNITEPDWANSLKLDIDTEKQLDDLENGIYIQEITK